jgi:UPF0755 protein
MIPRQEREPETGNRNSSFVIRAWAHGLGVFVAGALLLASCGRRPAPTLNGRMVEVHIRPGMSVKAIGDTLQQHGVIDNQLDFRFLAWLNHYGRHVRPGRYRLAAGSKEGHVLRVITREEPARLMVTIPEGYTAKQIAGLLEEDGICTSSDFMRACLDTVLLRGSGILSASAEGFLFPETYEISTAMPAEDVVRLLLRQFQSVIPEMKPQAATNLTDHELVTLASIVEKEAQAPDEFPRIAGVFMNRLRRRLPLQSCATVEYILPERKGRLSVEDTKLDSPYNTYLHLGLPPGPICNPGRRALAAAFSPERNDYLFFVARGDGSHIFSRTSAEHNAACQHVRGSG